MRGKQMTGDDITLILQSLADGKTLDEVADEQGLHREGMKMRLKRIRARMGCKTTLECIVTALRRSLID